MTWLLLAPLLVASTAAAQAPLPARQRQDRRAVLPATPAEPPLEVYLAAGTLTAVAFNGPLDKDSLVVDRTRFKWVDVGESTLILEPLADLSPDERLTLEVGFKDNAQPAKAVLALRSKADVVDGKVEVDRRAKFPEARRAENEPADLVFSGWLTSKGVRTTEFRASESSQEPSGLGVLEAFVHQGQPSMLVALKLRNRSGQKLLAPGTARLTGLPGAPVKVLSARMKPEQLAPGETGWLVVEAVLPLLVFENTFDLELVDASGQRRHSFNLTVRR